MVGGPCWTARRWSVRRQATVDSTVRWPERRRRRNCTRRPTATATTDMATRRRTVRAVIAQHVTPRRDADQAGTNVLSSRGGPPGTTTTRPSSTSLARCASTLRPAGWCSRWSTSVYRRSTISATWRSRRAPRRAPGAPDRARCASRPPTNSRGSVDRWAVRRDQHVVATAGHHPERLDVRRHVTVGRGDDGRAPAHHVVAGEQRSRRAVVEARAQVVRGVTRCVQGRHRPAVADGDHVAGRATTSGTNSRSIDSSIFDLAARRRLRTRRLGSSAVSGSSSIGSSPMSQRSSAMRAEADRRCAGLGRQPRGQAVSGRRGSASRGSPARCSRRGRACSASRWLSSCGPGSITTTSLITDDVGPGAVVRELRRVLGDHPAHERSDLAAPRRT